MTSKGLAKYGDLVMLMSHCKEAGRLGLVAEVPYGVPNCIKVFWMDSNGYSPMMRSNLEVISESR